MASKIEEGNTTERNADNQNTTQKIKEKLAQVTEERYHQTLFAFIEHTNCVFRKANECIAANPNETLNTADTKEICRSQTILSDMCELSELYKRMEQIVRCHGISKETTNDLSVDSSSVAIFLEVNPSILNSSITNPDSLTTVKGVHSVPEVQVFSGDDHLGQLPVFDENPNSAIPGTYDDQPPSYSDVPFTPDYPTGPFGFSSGQQFNNVFSVKLTHKKQLEINNRTKLAKIINTFVPSTIFNAEACFTPAVNGVYSLNVELCQYQNGEMDVWLCRRGHVSYVGKTKGHMLETSVMKIKALTKGQEHWIEVRQLKGNPAVYWCNFNGFLIERFPDSGRLPTPTAT